MENISVKINSVYPDGEVRGFASATIGGSLEITGIKVLGRDYDPNNIYVSMPTIKKRDQKVSVCMPVTDEFKEILQKAVLIAYKKAIEPSQEEIQEQVQEAVLAEEAEIEKPYNVEMENIYVKMDSFYVPEFNGEGNHDGMCGKATITIDRSFKIRGIKIVEDATSLSLIMPSRKAENGYEEICRPSTDAYKEILKKAVINSYRTCIAEVLLKAEVEEIQAQVDSQRGFEQHGERCEEMINIDPDQDENQEVNQAENQGNIHMGGM